MGWKSILGLVRLKRLFSSRAFCALLLHTCMRAPQLEGARSIQVFDFFAYMAAASYLASFGG